MRANKMLLCAAFLCAPAAAQLQPGLWEVQLRSAFGPAGGAPQSGPAQISRRCIGATESDNPRMWTPQFSTDLQCAVRDYTARDNEANWLYACKSEPAMSGTGRLRWSAQHYEGSNRMELRRGEERMQMLQSYEARRIGECTENRK
jgi:hypothetical protein